MHRLVSIAGTEEQVDAAKREIQRLIGTFAGVGEYDDSTAGAPQWSVLSSMHSLFSGSLDLQQLQNYMQGQMANPSFYQAPPPMLPPCLLFLPCRLCLLFRLCPTCPACKQYQQCPTCPTCKLCPTYKLCQQCL